MNNKGFTFVEILAVIVMIGILSSIAIVGVSKYRENAKNKDYEALAKASYNAMEEYMMAHPYKKKVSLETLDNDDFLSNRVDPATKSSNCTGSVEVERKTAGIDGSMDENEYTVYLCCTNYKKEYTYPSGDVTDYTGTDKCDVQDGDDEESVIPSPQPGEATYTCNAGYYLPKNKTSCEKCLSTYYCLGGTFAKRDSDQGLSPCPKGYRNSNVGSSKIEQCYMQVPKNKFVKKAKDTSATECNNGYEKAAHNVYYGKTSTCSTTTYTITYNLKGGSVSGNPTTYTVETNTFTLKKPTKSGQTFLGWTGSNGTSLQKTVKINKGSTGNKTYTADWERTESAYIYFITSKSKNCNKNNGSFSNQPERYRGRPYRKYNYHSYKCTCKVNSANKSISNQTTDPPERNIHPDNDMTIFYQNTNAGSNSCKEASGYYINQNVYDICINSDFRGQARPRGYHGYVWYENNEGSSAKYKTNDYSGWYHSNRNYNTRYKPSNPTNNATQRKKACTQACNAIYDGT